MNVEPELLALADGQEARLRRPQGRRGAHRQPGTTQRWLALRHHQASPGGRIDRGFRVGQHGAAPGVRTRLRGVRRIGARLPVDIAAVLIGGPSLR